jgi:low molecular weight phosphotyrosine protein phosphatase
MNDPISVLFVCLGNICRSTMAEGVFQSMAKKAPYTELVSEIDSCGTGKLARSDRPIKVTLPDFPNLFLPGGYHVGDEPDDRTMATLRKHGITDYIHAARKVCC